MKSKKLVEPIRRLFGRKPNILEPPPVVKAETKVADDPPPSVEDSQLAAEPSPAPPSAKEESGTADDPEPPPGEVDQTAAASSSAPPAENHTFSTAKEAVKTALTVLKESLDGVPVPGLKAAVGGVLELMKIFENVTGNREELERLASRIRELEAQIRGPPGRLPGDQLPAPLQSKASSLVNALNAMAEDAKRMIGKLNIDIDRLIASFIMGTAVRIESKIDVEHMRIQKSEDEKLIREMPHADARYKDTSTKPSQSCHPGTRVSLLQIIRDWINDESSSLFFWLCGEVGVGKTTVAHTIAKEQDALRQLGASFFFNRDNDQRRRPDLFPSTIAYQLARFDIRACQTVVNVLRTDPDMAKLNLKEQFPSLVVQPLICIGESSSRKVVLVIDGLDECSDPEVLLDILPLLTRHAGLHLRVLITSRPHAAIVTKFKSTRLCHLTNETQFRDINFQTLNNDVRTYLEWSLGEIASDYSLPSPWPSPKDADKLVCMAGGLFVLASVFDRYIRDPVEGNPAERLDCILSRTKAVGDSPTAGLDLMYDLVLEDLKRSLAKKDVVFARNTLQLSFFSSNGGMPVKVIADVLDRTPANVFSVLRRMASVLILPSGDDGCIIPFHASFGEYIQDPERCSVKDFAMEPALSHAELVLKFLEVFIRAVRRGIAGIEYYDYRNSPPQNLRFADRELCYHVSLASDPAPLPCQHVKDKYCKDGVLLWSFIRYWGLGEGEDDEDRVVVERIKKAGFAIACHIQDEASIQHSMVQCILDTIPHLSTRHSFPNRYSNGATYEHSRIANVADLQQFKIKHQWDSHLWHMKSNEPRCIARILLKWSTLQHPNIVPLRGIDFEPFLTEKPAAYTPLVLQYPYLKGNWYPSLRKASRQTSEEAVRPVLELVHALQYLLESESQQWLPIRIEGVVLSKEGKAMIHPLLLTYCSSVEPSPIDAERHSFLADGLENWRPLREGGAVQMVWEFGCVLYEMMTGELPLMRYHNMVMASEIGDDESTDGEAPLQVYRDLIQSVGASPTEKYGLLKPSDYWSQRECKPPYEGLEGEAILLRRYQTAVKHLLSDLQISEDLKVVLRAFWSGPWGLQPSIQDIIAHLTIILEGLRNQNPAGT